jgi:hypothetical protein
MKQGLSSTGIVFVGVFLILLGLIPLIVEVKGGTSAVGGTESSSKEQHWNVPLTPTQFKDVSRKLRKLIGGKGEEHPDFLRKFFLYDRTAKQALQEMNAFFYENQIPLPLFRNRLQWQPRGIEPPKVCVAVMTARRVNSPIAYVVQTVVALLNRMQYNKYSDDVYIHVFNVDPEPDRHTDVDHVRHLVPVTNVRVAIRGEESFPLGSRSHENVDYAAILRILLEMKCEYPIIVEDDALATDNWVESINLLIHQLEARTGQEKSWFVVKLYTARQSGETLPMTRGLNSFDQGFNSVAVMMNPMHILGFAQVLEENVENVVSKKDNTQIGHTDLLMQKFGSSKKDLFTGSFDPVVFQHTGVYSSVMDREVDEYSVNLWYMSAKDFESEGVPIRFDAGSWTSDLESNQKLAIPIRTKQQPIRI